MLRLSLAIGAMLVTCCSLSSGSQYYNYYRSYFYVPSTVAFSLTKTELQTFPAAATVQFNKVLTNVGNAFQADSNQVKIPATGLYYFSYFAPGNQTDNGNVDFVKNGEVLFSSMGLNGGNSAVLFCKRGDRIFLRGRENSVVVGSTADVKATFSGFLIKSGFFENKYK